MRYFVTVGSLVVALSLGGCALGKTTIGTPPVSGPEVKNLTVLGHNLIQQGEFEQARPSLESAAASPLADAEAHFLLGISRYQTSDLAGALQAYDRAIQLDPAFVRAYQGKANVYRNQGDLNTALEWYRKAWEVQPGFLDAYTEAAIQLSIRGDHEKAEAVLQQALEKNPEAVSLWRLLSSLQLQSGDERAAVKSLKEALRLMPTLSLSKAETELVNQK